MKIYQEIKDIRGKNIIDRKNFTLINYPYKLFFPFSYQIDTVFRKLKIYFSMEKEIKQSIVEFRNLSKRYLPKILFKNQ